MTIAGDGVSEYAGTFALGQSAPVTLDLTNVFRVTLAATSTGGGVAAVGDAEVLCSF